MEAGQAISLIDVVIPFTIVLFIIAVGVVLLYTNFQKNLYRQELDKATLKSTHDQELLRNSILVQEEERKRIANDLHDELGAVISIMRMNLVLMQQKVKKETTAPDLISSVESLISLSESGISSVRSISHELMPPQLETFGLIKTLEYFAEKINKSGKISICLSQKSELPSLQWPVTLGLYRMIMELINNTIKHAEAEKINIEFDYKDYHLLIHFQDDGKGLNITNEDKPGMGFKNIEARAMALNGEFEYRSEIPNAGFKAIIKIPFQ